MRRSRPLLGDRTGPWVAAGEDEGGGGDGEKMVGARLLVAIEEATFAFALSMIEVMRSFIGLGDMGGDVGSNAGDGIICGNVGVVNRTVGGGAVCNVTGGDDALRLIVRSGVGAYSKSAVANIERPRATVTIGESGPTTERTDCKGDETDGSFGMRGRRDGESEVRRGEGEPFIERELFAETDSTIPSAHRRAVEENARGNLISRDERGE